jgi:ABC-type multidrug transport system permease subunit
MMLLRQFVIEWKLYSRDRVALFWTFLFPVVLLLGFGVIFRDGKGPQLVILRVLAAAETAEEAALRKALEDQHARIETVAAREAEARWKDGRVPVLLEPGPRMRVNAYLMAQGMQGASLVQQAFLVAQARLQGAPEPRRVPLSVESPGRARATNYAAFLLPGLLGLNLLTMGLFSVGMVNVSYREKGKFRRLAVTPLPKWVFLMGQVFHRLTVIVLQSAVVMAVGWFVFGIRNEGSYLAFCAVMALGTGAFMALGFALSSFANTSESYAAISNAFFFPMMLLSGVYFTLDAAPRWLQQAVTLLPLSPYLKALRTVFNDGGSPLANLPGLAVVLAWGLLGFAVAVKRFRWA